MKIELETITSVIPIASIAITFLTFIWTISWTILQDKRSKYKNFIDKKDEQLLNKILLPFYETIEINLYQTITTENIEQYYRSLKHFIEYIRNNNLFFYLGSNFTKVLLSIEQDFLLSDIKNKTLEFKKLNKMYTKFSYYYLTLSWKVRTNLKIENNQYRYKKVFNMLNTSDIVEYHLNPVQLAKSYFYFLILFLGLFFIFIVNIKIEFLQDITVWTTFFQVYTTLFFLIYLICIFYLAIKPFITRFLIYLKKFKVFRK